jgi:hypothetical protein
MIVRNPERRKQDWGATARNWAAIMAALAALATAAWAKLAEPRISCMIETAITPIRDAMEWSASCQMATMTDEQLKTAQKYYEQSKRGRGVR